MGKTATAAATAVLVFAAVVEIIVGWPRAVAILTSLPGSLLPHATSAATSPPRTPVAATETPAVSLPAVVASPNSSQWVAVASLRATEPSTTPPGRFKYVADLAAWPVGSNWKHLGTWLAFGGTSPDEFVYAPFQPPSANYEVTAQIQVLHPDSFVHSGYYQSFGIVVRSTNAGQYYGGLGQSSLFVSTTDGYSALGLYALASKTVPVDGGWHTYSFRAVGDRLTISIDGVAVSTADNQFLDPGSVGLWSGTAINVRAFTVTSIGDS